MVQGYGHQGIRVRCDIIIKLAKSLPIGFVKYSLWIMQGCKSREVNTGP
jgi:hypothetical protein